MKHIGFPYRFIGMLLLFFNCVCTATPIIKTASDNYKQFIALQNSDGAESPEKNHLTDASYYSTTAHFSTKNQHQNFLPKTKCDNDNAGAIAISADSYFTSLIHFPKPAYYLFLFRYNLF